ncbi:hypothetical protein ACFQL0_15605 [Haloplanus litoreus]|uniref:hypothetical protein n=1 Tax=Haloplanus litoreus TaxID=767515 RepID=UPI00361C7B67
MSQGESNVLLKPALLLVGTVIAAVVVVFALNGVLAYLGIGAVGPAGPQADAPATPQANASGSGESAVAAGEGAYRSFRERGPERSGTARTCASRSSTTRIRRLARRCSSSPSR